MPTPPISPSKAHGIVVAKSATLVNAGIPVKTRKKGEPKLAPTVQLASGPAAPVSHVTFTFHLDAATGTYSCTMAS